MRRQLEDNALSRKSSRHLPHAFTHLIVLIHTADPRVNYLEIGKGKA
ncbi:MAG: hypothetical protein H7249_09420 [Chitinophagaceae bacterium]|nr:hypothetical protein [Oligoflexus sp.]